MAGGYMGWWGHMGGPKQRGIVSYSISPYQQRVFAGVLTKSSFNVVRRTSAQVPYIVPAFALGYLVYWWGNKTFAFYESKAGQAYLKKLEE
ncbi:ubiquinol--cytochrome-c reductase subunit 8 [Entomophthora muscae]|uniref:Ubiquinol--cytochrome-c reductase subunit 8 n=1 Tax=Entomophthora muscae TaxID=34485 RepID=A0ACC2RHY7_9FUNG|nr:ubiquinol--cytochrome-c reductase subunit 8 [Entomophthora muscae]